MSRISRIARLLTAALLTAAGLAAAEPAAGGAMVTEGDTVQLPDMEVFGGFTKKDFPFPLKSEIDAADIRSGTAPPNIHYPGKAHSAGVRSGSATVAVMLDAQGRPTDFLLVRYTQPYFGEEVMYEARLLKYAARRIRGQAIPGSFHFTYRFSAPPELAAMNSFEASSQEIEKVGGGPKPIYEPHRETELDAGQLELKQLAIPVDPEPPPPAGRPPFRVLVTFYVDEQGKLRLPNIESDVSPERAARAVEALGHWAFKPPTIRGRPVLVHAARSLAFQAPGSAAAASAGADPVTGARAPAGH